MDYRILHWVSDLQTGQGPCQNPDPPIRTNQVRSDGLNQVRGTAARSPHWTRGPPGQLRCHEPVHEALEVVKARLTKDPTLVGRTSIRVPQLLM